jgi:uncharacterized protein with FMN-binding domain
MRRVVVGAMGTVSGLVLLFSYHTSLGGSALASGTTAGGTTTGAGSDGSASTPTPTQSSSGSSSSSAPSTSSSSSSSSSSSGKSSSSKSSSGSSGTYTGQSVDTRWGPVQVQITVKNGKITAAQAVVFPQENPRDQEINSFAVPQLNSEAVQAQSGNIDAVSGATVTSGGYIQSLQSAVDQAHLS